MPAYIITKEDTEMLISMSKYNYRDNLRCQEKTIILNKLGNLGLARRLEIREKPLVGGVPRPLDIWEITDKGQEKLEKLEADGNKKSKKINETTKEGTEA